MQVAFISVVKLLSQISLENSASRTCFEFADSFLFDLSYALACEIELDADLFQGLLRDPNAKEFAKDICFTWCELL